MKTFVKDPDATLDYSVDWSLFLAGADDDTILTATWVDYDTDDLTVTDAGHQAGVHTGFISGGTLGSTYTVTSRITTAGGRINDETIVLLIRET